MKPLITTQLIEEEQKRIAQFTYLLKHNDFNRVQREAYQLRIKMARKFIRSLQSKQSEERQNIVDAYSIALTSFSGMEQTANKEAEDYFNQTFKQEQK